MFKGRLRLVAVTHDVTTPTAPSVLTSVSWPSGVVPCHVQHRHDSPPRLEHLTGQEVEGRRRGGGAEEGRRGRLTHVMSRVWQVGELRSPHRRRRGSVFKLRGGGGHMAGCICDLGLS